MSSIAAIWTEPKQHKKAASPKKGDAAFALCRIVFGSMGPDPPEEIALHRFQKRHRVPGRPPPHRPQPGKGRQRRAACPPIFGSIPVFAPPEPNQQTYFCSVFAEDARFPAAGFFAAVLFAAGFFAAAAFRAGAFSAAFFAGAFFAGAFTAFSFHC